MKAKRIIPVLASLLLAGAMFVGCGGASNSGGNNGGNNSGNEAGDNGGGSGTPGTGDDNGGSGTPGTGDDNGGSGTPGTGDDNGGSSTPGSGDDDGGDTPVTGDTSTPFDGKIYLVGDSTVCAFSDAYYIPRYGYGTQLYNYINMPSSNIVNYAWSGRSSYSLTVDSQSKPNYDALKANISDGDYLFIGFGHNDEKFELDRYADPTLASDDDTTMIGSYDAGRPVSFKYILKHYYIDVALDAGATPVLCTPISRLFEDSKISSYDTDHVTTTKTNYTDATSGATTDWNGGDYAQAIRDLGDELGVLVVDLTATTRADYKAKGYAEASKSHAATGAKWTDESKTEKVATGIDGTHTNLFGAMTNAYYIAEAVKASALSLKDSIKTDLSKPVYEDYAEACINPNYTIPETESFDPTTDVSARWAVNGTVTDATTQTAYNWYGTAFGNGAPFTNFSIAQGSDDNGVTFTISADASKGKIASDNDIIAAVFIQLPLKTAFTISASANVTSFGGNQAGFGIMVRDDIYIDYAETVSSNYVNAGVRASSTAVIMDYARNSGSLVDGTKVTTNGASLPLGVYDLSLARTSQSVTAKIGTYTYKAESDFDFAVSDGEYVYVCLWATRGTTVTFSNIQFATGEWQQA